MVDTGCSKYRDTHQRKNNKVRIPDEYGDYRDSRADRDRAEPRPAFRGHQPITTHAYCPLWSDYGQREIESNALYGEQVAGAGVGARVTQLRHRPGFDLTDAFPGEVEVLADLFERARLAAVETEPQREDLALALVERCEELFDLGRQECSGRDLERRLDRTVFDDIAELGVAVFA